MLLWLGRWSQPQQQIYSWERKGLRWRSGPVEVQTSERAVHKQMPTKYNGLKKSCKAKWAPQKNHTVNNHFKLLHCIVILFHRTAKSHVSPFHITGDVFEPNWAMKSTTDLFFVSSLMWLVTKKKMLVTEAKLNKSLKLLFHKEASESPRCFFVFSESRSVLCPSKRYSLTCYPNDQNWIRAPVCCL